MRQINFIPVELRAKLEMPSVLVPAGLFLVLCLYIAGTFVSHFVSIQKLQNAVIQVEAENAEVAKKLETLGGAKRMKMDQTIEAMKKVLLKKNYLSGIFKEMSILIPDGLWLTGFSHTSDINAKTKLEQRTLLITGESASPEIVAQFLTRLEKSKLFSAVVLKFSEKESNIRPARYKFEFSIPVQAMGGDGV